MKSDILRVARDGGCWTLTLNRPEKMNALSAELVDALLDALADAHAQHADVLVLRGEGRNFSAGFDFGGVDAQSEGDLLLRFVRIEQLLHAISASPCLTVALAHGKNFGAGVDLFGACKWRCATPDASFRMPGLKFGLVLGTRRFAALVGRETARGVLETARAFSAEEAHAMGFASRLETSDQWSALLAQAREAAAALHADSRAQLYRALGGESPAEADADLAALVRSAAAPGLKARIDAYLRPKQ